MSGLTPLQVARHPTIDALAARGRLGTLATVPPSMTPDSAVANLSVLGYDPLVAYQGRGVLEAASLGVELGPDDIAARCNLIAIDDQDRILDHSSGHIHTDEALELLTAVNDELGGDGVEFHPGTAYRHLLVLRGPRFDPRLHDWPPHDHVGRPIADCAITATAPQAEYTATLLNDLTARSRAILRDHPVNAARRAAGKREASSIWFWAAGRKPSMRTLEDRFGIRGAVISAVDLIHGLGRYAGMTSVDVPGVTGLYDTNYEGKADGALRALEHHDLVYVHVEGPDEAGHARDLGLKIHAIEQTDRRLLARVVAGCEAAGHKTVFAVLPDHLTPVERGDHVGEPVPVLIADPDHEADADDVTTYNEVTARQGALGALSGAEFIETLLWRCRP
jgi:2,3-bisphosphoglycerate-independent phosphoglycerate mutase